MSHALQWPPSTISANLVDGDKPKAVKEFHKLSADRMAIVLGSVRKSLNPTTFNKLMNSLKAKVEKADRNSSEYRLGTSFIQFIAKQ